MQKKAAYENTFHLILEALSNSKKYWETINVDYISNKCMSMAFEDLINAIGTPFYISMIFCKDTAATSWTHNKGSF